MARPFPLPTTVPSSALVAAAILLAGPIDRDTPLGRLAAPDVQALEASGFTEGGYLRPEAAALVELVTWPELVAEVIRQVPHGPVERTVVWARSDVAVLGAPVDETITLERIDVSAVAAHLLAACAVEDHEPDVVEPFLVADLLTALLTDDGPRLAAALDRAAATGSADLPRMVAAPATAPTAWRLEASWTASDGPRRGTLSGLDAGALGTWEIDGTGPSLTLRPASTERVRRHLSRLLPPGTGAARPAGPGSDDSEEPS